MKSIANESTVEGALEQEDERRKAKVGTKGDS